MQKHWIFALGGLLVGAGAYAGTTAVWPRPAPSVTPRPDTSAEPACREEATLRDANGKLVDSLHECDRKLAELGVQHDMPAIAMTNQPARGEDAGRRRGGMRGGGEPTKEDWERMAKAGAVRVRIPCIRDKPWTPPQNTLDRLGLAPQDADTIKEAYEKSNKRMMDQIRPICAKVLGSPDVADKVGPSACMDAIMNSSRKSDADGTKQALTRVAEVNAGSRQPPKTAPDTPAIEQLGLALTAEQKAFEADLAQRLGPDEAKRLANAPEMCSDRRILRASDDANPFGGGRGAQ